MHQPIFTTFKGKVPAFMICYDAPIRPQQQDNDLPSGFIKKVTAPAWFAYFRFDGGVFQFEIIEHYGPVPARADLADALKDAEVFLQHYYGLSVAAAN